MTHRDRVYVLPFHGLSPLRPTRLLYVKRLGPGFSMLGFPGVGPPYCVAFGLLDTNPSGMRTEGAWGSYAK